MLLCKNVGSIDRGVRSVFGIALLIVAFAYLGAQHGALPGILAALAGVVLLGTAAVGMCPMYIPFRFSTSRWN